MCVQQTSYEYTLPVTLLATMWELFVKTLYRTGQWYFPGMKWKRQKRKKWGREKKKKRSRVAHNLLKTPSWSPEVSSCNVLSAELYHLSHFFLFYLLKFALIRPKKWPSNTLFNSNFPISSRSHSSTGTKLWLWPFFFTSTHRPIWKITVIQL